MIKWYGYREYRTEREDAMRSVGIIAEYNPFHRGHRRQITFLREQGAENIAVALSGFFVQRGAPAWTDKSLRTRMALEQGADFVFELPVLYALSSAEGFAWGGVSLLNALPLDGICFGSEYGSLESLQKIADFLAEQDCPPSMDNPPAGQAEPSQYQKYLRSYMKQGNSYPTARELALSHFFPQALLGDAGIVSSANNILAIEYLKALKKSKSTLVPMTLTRNDSGYHSQRIDGDLSSASAIRHAYASASSLSSCRDALPGSVYSLLSENPRRYPMQVNDFSELLYLRLRQMEPPEEYALYAHVSPELARRIWKALPEYTDFSSFIQRLKTKNSTYSHISRALTCLLLGITEEQMKQAGQAVPYLRLLGMRREKSSLLRQITALPVITKAADYLDILTSFYQDRRSFALDCFRTDLLAADIYRQTMYHKLGYMLPDEYRSGVQIV